MSDAEPAPESMSRAELEQTVGDLRDQVGDLQTDMAFVKKSLTTLTDADLGDEAGVTGLPDAAADTREDIEDLEGAVTSHGETLATIADVGEDTTTEEEKTSSIVAYAEQARNPSTNKVLVTPKEVQGATGVSQRYAYDLVDKIGGGDEGGGFEDGRFEWAAVREATSVPGSDGPERKPKALKIDFDRVQQDPESLNWFNNGSGGQQGR